MKLIDPFFKKGNPKSRQSTWIFITYTQHNTKHGEYINLKTQLVCDDE